MAVKQAEAEQARQQDQQRQDDQQRQGNQSRQGERGRAGQQNAQGGQQNQSGEQRGLSRRDAQALGRGQSGPVIGQAVPAPRRCVSPICSKGSKMTLS